MSDLQPVAGILEEMGLARMAVVFGPTGSYYHRELAHEDWWRDPRTICGQRMRITWEQVIVKPGTRSKIKGRRPCPHGCF